MNITPSADLTTVVGVPADVCYQLTNRYGTRLHTATVVIDEAHHGDTARPGFGLENGVRGRAVFRTVNGQRAYGSSWFYWPYDGLTITAAPQGVG